MGFCLCFAVFFGVHIGARACKDKPVKAGLKLLNADMLGI
jgi:hypothetical protein